MKSRSNPFVRTAALAVIAFATASAIHAAQTYDDASASNVWDSTTTNWGGIAWANTLTSDAIFAGTGESVTVTTVNAQSITFNSSSYTLTGSTITLGGTPVITTNSNATISSVIASSALISKSGTGTLTLGGNNTTTITGGLTISQGTVKMANAGALGTGILTLSNGGTLDLNGNAYSPGTTAVSSVGSSIVNNGAGAVSIGFGSTTFNSLIDDSAGGAISLSLGGGGSSPTFTNTGNKIRGTISIFNGTTTVANLAAGSFGTGDIVIGNGANAPTLIYSGATNSDASARNINMQSGAGGGAQIANNGAGTLTLGGASASFATTKTLTLRGTNTGANTMAGAISNGVVGATVSVSKSEAGTWVLAGANSYTGVTTLTAGTLSVGTIGDGGVASGNLGSATSAETNIVFNGGTLQYTGVNATSDRAFTINAAKTATIDTANNISFAGATGATTNGALTKTGLGTLSLTGVNTYTGTTTISAGTLEIGGAGQLNSGSYAPSIVNNGAFLYNSSAAQALTGVMSGTGSLTKDNSGTLTLTERSTYTGGTTVNGGFLNLGATPDGNVGPIRGTLTVNSGGTVKGTGANVFGVVAGVSALNINGGTVDLSNGGANTGQVHFIVSNMPVNMTGGTLKFSISTTNEIFNNLFTVNSSPDQAQILAVAGGAMRLRSGDYRFDVADGAQAVDLLLDVPLTTAVSGGLTKSGTGTMQLTKANTYTGATAINAGTLLVSGSTSSSSTVTVASTNAATLGGTGTISGATTVNGNLAPGSNAVGKLTFITGGLTLGNLAASSLKFELGANTTAGTTYDTVATNTLAIGAGTLDFADFQFTNTGALAAGSYTLISSTAAITGTLGGTLSGTIGSFNGTLSISGNNLILTVTAGGSPYTTWAGGFPGFTPTTGTLDFENDGIQNLLEFVLGGNPTTNDSPSIRPTVNASGSDLVVTFNRTDLSETQPVTVKVQTSPDLVTWTDFATIGATDGSGYTVAENAAAADTIVVTIPKAAATKKFARVTAE